MINSLEDVDVHSPKSGITELNLYVNMDMGYCAARENYK